MSRRELESIWLCGRVTASVALLSAATGLTAARCACPACRRCVSSLLIKWRTLLPAAALIKLCTAATAAAFLPSMWLQFRDLRGQRLLASLALCALAFYQFSFQVGFFLGWPVDAARAEMG